MEGSADKIGCCYLVDSENIKDTWIDLLDTMREEDRLLVFYTMNSAHVRCEQVEKLMKLGSGRVSWIRCYEGSNALDFQLVTRLGAMIAEKLAEEYVIVSRDTGFDAVVKYWNREGEQIRRSRGADEEEAEDHGRSEAPRADHDAQVQMLIERRMELLSRSRREDKKSEDKKESSKKEKNSKKHSDKKNTESKEKDAGKKESDKKESDKKESDKKSLDKREKNIARLAKSIDISDMSAFHNAFVAFFGAKEGDEYYRYLKALGEERADYAKFYLGDKHQRTRNYVELMLETEKQDTKDAAELYRTLAKAPKKDLQKLNSLVTKKFGAKKGGQYYKILKRHVNILRNM